MGNRKKHIKYRPSKAQSGFGVIGGAIFVLIGLFVIIPTFGPVGIIWTLFAVAFIGMSVYQLMGNYVGGEYIIEEEGGDESEKPAAPPPAPVDESEERLKKLQSLHDQCLITDTEYEEKRKEILKLI